MIIGAASLAMPYADLFGWWIACITFNILFVVAASIYLYVPRGRKESEVPTVRGRIARRLKDFVFVWILFGLLFFYIFSVGVGSSLIFAVGNIIVQVLLLLYLVRNSDRRDRS